MTRIGASFLHQLERKAGVAGQRRRALSQHDGRDDQVVLVDQASLDGLRRQPGAADGDIPGERLATLQMKDASERMGQALWGQG